MIQLKVLLDVDTDLGAVWEETIDYEGVHLGGENHAYTISYIGEQAIAMKILEICLKYSPSGKFYANYNNSTTHQKWQDA